MPNCAIFSCKNYSRLTKAKDTAIRYFRFPVNVHFRKQWIIACCRKDKFNLENARICSSHFDPDCFEIPMRQRLLNYTTTNSRVLKNDAVPTLNIPKKSSLQKELSSRSIRMLRKQRKEVVDQIIANSSTSGYLQNIHEPIVNINEPIVNIEEITIKMECDINEESEEHYLQQFQS